MPLRSILRTPEHKMLEFLFKVGLNDRIAFLLLGVVITDIIVNKKAVKGTKPNFGKYFMRLH